jgi:hypothetical protein
MLLPTGCLTQSAGEEDVVSEQHVLVAFGPLTIRERRIGDLESKLDKLLTTISHPDSKHLDACLEPVEQTSNTVPFDQASALVAHFQGSMTLHFPFVCFPPGTLLDETRQSETLLLLVILAAAAYENPARQGALVQKVQTAINKLLHSDAMFTVKMLQALLIHVAWSADSSSFY